MENLQKAIAKANLKGVVIVPGPNMAYFTGVDSFLLERPFMMLVPVDGKPQLIVPVLESGPYFESDLPMSIHKWTDSQGSGGATRDAVEALKMNGMWGVEAKAPFGYLNSVMAYASPSAADAEPLLQGLREVKDEAELKLLKRSAKVISKAFASFPEVVEEGISEIELAREAADLIATNGATSVEDVLVQAGENSADPHHLHSKRKIKRGDTIVIDAACTFDGYYSDITRTFCLGKSKEVENVYSKVLEAEEAGIRASGAGVEVGKVDGSARGTLKDAGLGRYFTHRTGHGLGLEVHEAPYIVEGGKERLQEGVCFTVEPGAYIRGKFGVRIEDNIVIENGRGVAISDAPKEYGWWT